METAESVRKSKSQSSKAVEQIPKILLEGVELNADNCNFSNILNKRNAEKNPKDGEQSRLPSTTSFKRCPEMLSKFLFGDNKEQKEISLNHHVFIKYKFKKATFCDVCQRLLLDYCEKRSSLMSGNMEPQRDGLRCKICKSNLHFTCTDAIEPCKGSPNLCCFLGKTENPADLSKRR
ncbi:unnamed protein product [Clavelina lepadiformis]|uniref:Phorbol-ester/DAG-type domain-containing protein n=1 Tax=Clavelina lepadiformis TaxID=159417 RepID=A0ABP0FI45_CLALP